MTADGARDPAGETPAVEIAPEDLIRFFDSGPLGFLATTSDDAIVAVNSTLLEWLQYERAHLVGASTLQKLLPGGDRIYYETHVRPLLHVQDEVSEIALQLVRADGSRLPVLINAARSVDSRTGNPRIDFVVFDARDRRNYELELLRERQAAELTGQRLEVLYDLVTGLATAQTMQQVVDVVTERGARSANGARCGVWLITADERRATFVGSDRGIDAVSTAEVTIPDEAPALERLRSGELVVIPDIRADEAALRAAYPVMGAHLAASDQGSVAIAPLAADGELWGLLAYGFEEAHEFDDAERQVIASLAEQTTQALRRTWFAEAETRSRERLEVLLRFTSVLSGSVTLDDVVRVLVKDGVDLLGATGARVAMLDLTGDRVVIADGTGVGGDASVGLDSRTIGAAVIRNRRLISTVDRADLAERFPDSLILDEAEAGRVVAVPLRRGRDVFGAWVLSFGDEGVPDDDDLKVIRLFAEQASHAARRAAFHEAEVLARRQSDLRHLISEAMNRSVTTSDVARAITDEGQTAFGAGAIAVFSVQETEPLAFDLISFVGVTSGVAVAASDALPDSSAVTRALSRLTPVYLDDPEAVRRRLGGPFADAAWQSAALLPLVHSGRPLGLILMLFDHADALDTPTRVVLSGVGAEASVVIGRARQHEADHRVAVTLQRAMLPADTPAAEGWRISSCFLPGSEQLLVGGDLFDVTTFPDGRVAIVVGDVVGHGLGAAASMGQLRSAAKALALLRLGPATILNGLDDFANLTPGAKYSSVACAVIDVDGTGRYACAGHPFPMLVRSDGHVDILDAGRSSLLTIRGAEPRDDAPFTIPVGSTLVLYTDGLIERRGEPIDKGMVRLLQYLGSVDFSGPGDQADRVAAALTGTGGADDDVVVVCVTRI